MNKDQEIKQLKEAIRKKCLDCTCFKQKEIDMCPVEDCPLWEFREVKNKENEERILAN